MILDKIASKLLAWSEESGVRVIISKPGEKGFVRGTLLGWSSDIWGLRRTFPRLCLVCSFIIFVVDCLQSSTVGSCESPGVIVFVKHCDVCANRRINLVLRGILILDRLQEGSEN